MSKVTPLTYFIKQVVGILGDHGTRQQQDDQRNHESKHGEHSQTISLNEAERGDMRQ
jgi:hypothetical protein